MDGQQRHRGFKNWVLGQPDQHKHHNCAVLDAAAAGVTGGGPAMMASGYGYSGYYAQNMYLRRSTQSTNSTRMLTRNMAMLFRGRTLWTFGMHSVCDFAHNSVSTYIHGPSVATATSAPDRCRGSSSYKQRLRICVPLIYLSVRFVIIYISLLAARCTHLFRKSKAATQVQLVNSILM